MTIRAKPIRFDDAWGAARALAENAADRTGPDVVLVRDLLGRVSLVVDDRDRTRTLPSGAALADLAQQLVQQTGPFAAPAPVVAASELFLPEQILQARDLCTVRERNEHAGSVSVLERGVMGAEWLHPREEVPGNRVALYGFKGGVGRSTAAFFLAQHLASRGCCVLVVDLDVESPGVGALLSGDNDLPEYGLLDHLVESAVGNSEGLDLIARSKEVRVGGNGEVWVAPAGGRPREGYDHLAKLNRAYLDAPTSGSDQSPTGFAERLEAAVRACEEQVTLRSRAPDVVLLDSRAGIHDVAAITITQLADLSLLFASDSVQTWNGYRALFGQWSRVPQQARLIRERLRMVAAMVPRSGHEEYLERFRDHAQECFAATLYDEIPGPVPFQRDRELFNPAPDDEAAPHSPLPIYFSPDLLALDAAAHRSWHEADPGAYTAFLAAAAELIVGDHR
ncbi:MAG: KGGVGR-motif variant AAA ATPase [Mycobacteriales bacterium]